MIPIGLLVVEAAFLAVAHAVGGPPWTIVAAIGFTVLAIGARRHDGGWREPLWLILPSLGWLAASWATGNRELFFPFTMYLAAHAALTVSRHGRVATAVAGGVVVAAFLVFRVLQGATPRVLAVEAIAAGAILAAACVAIARRERSLPGDGLILALASAAAWLSLRLPT